MKPLVPYTKSPNLILTASDLLPSERILYLIILMHTRDNTVCWPTQRTLAREVGCCDRQIKNLLKRLVSKGLVRIIKEAGRKNNTYLPLVTIEGKSISPHTGTIYQPNTGTALPTNSNQLNRKKEKKGNFSSIGDIMSSKINK